MSKAYKPDHSKIPEFKSLEEAAEFWDTHDTTEFEDEFEPVEMVAAPKLAHKRVFEAKLDKVDAREAIVRGLQDRQKNASMAVGGGEGLYDLGLGALDTLGVSAVDYPAGSSAFVFVDSRGAGYDQFTLPLLVSDRDGASPQQIRLLARDRGAVWWNRSSADFTINDLVYSQRAGVVPRSNTVAVRIGRGEGGGWIPHLSYLPWSELAPFIDLLRVHGQDIVSNVMSGTLVLLLEKLLSSRGRYERRGSESPGDLVQVVNNISINTGKEPSVPDIMRLLGEDKEVAEWLVRKDVREAVENLLKSEAGSG